MKDKFIKYFMAKEFHLTPIEIDNMGCSELDTLYMISQEFNKKRNDELDENKMKAKAARR